MDLAIGELARRSGYAVQTLRYYEQIGLMPKPPGPREVSAATVKICCAGCSSSGALATWGSRSKTSAAYSISRADPICPARPSTA